jgi:hypothetical protein
MSIRKPRIPTDESGAVLVLVAISMIFLLAILALAIDLGMLITARSEAQRAADAAALAGASVFMEVDPEYPADTADARARASAAQNHVRNQLIEPDAEVDVWVLVDSMKVRVRVRREGIRTWFARLVGITEVPVSAIAAAEVTSSGTTRCVAPFAIPDMWHDSDDDTDEDGLWDEEESWVFGTGEDDRYQRFNSTPGADNSTATGFGSGGYQGVRDDHRTGGADLPSDWGLQIKVKVADPQDPTTLQPGLFYPWRLPADPNQTQGACGQGGGGGNEPGGAAFRRNICSCNMSAIETGVPYDVEPGNMVGPAYQGIRDLIQSDAGATWNEMTGTLDNSRYGDPSVAMSWMDSPRVMKVGLFDPTTQLQNPGFQPITFNNFAYVFIESQASPQSPIIGRLLYYVEGDDSGPSEGSLIKYLRLVE